MIRYAAIDIGSNAVRLLIADIIINGKTVSFKKNTLIRVPLRLGDDAFLHQYISPGKQEDLVKTMSAFRGLMDVYKVSEYMACATSAMREAANGDEVVTKIKEVGINLQIIDGDREAAIIYNSHAGAGLENGKSYLYIDVGGGSTELSLFADSRLVASRSFNLGTIRILDNQDKESTWDEMRSWLKQQTAHRSNIIGIGTGGNINKIARMLSDKDIKMLTLDQLKDMYRYLNSFPLKDRISVLGLKEDRADVIIPACRIFVTVLQWAKARKLIVPKSGLVDGVIQTLIDRKFRKSELR